MEKLPMCRVCLAANVRMYVVVNRNLHELYERLTNNPFITEDKRPMLACFLCCAKLKQCCQFQRKCLEAEKLFAQMMKDDYEPKPLINQDHLECYNGFIQSPLLHVSIVDECQTESDDIKEELPAVCKGPDGMIKPKEEHLSDELELENLNNSYSNIEEMPAKQDLQDDLPLMEIKIEVEEEQEALQKKQSPSDMQQLELENLNNSYSDIKYMPAKQSMSDLEDDPGLTEVEEEKEESRKKRRPCDTQRSPIAKKTKLYIRARKLEDVITEKPKEQTDTEVIQNTPNCTPKVIPKFEEPLTYEKPRVTISITNTALDSKQHIHKHTGENPFKCDVCQRCFNRRSCLTNHIRIHAYKKSFKCDECQRCFYRKHLLTCHIRTHTGEKPFQCDVCLRRFKQKIHLTRHIGTHTGEKSFKCGVCQSCFSRKDRLTCHIRKHTGENSFKSVSA